MNLDDWRSRINDLDNRILQLLNQRAEAANQIGDLKRRQDTPSYAPEREAEIVRRLTASRDGLLGAEAIGAIWREILSACRALESALTISYFGPPATFTHQAAVSRFGSAVSYRPAKTIADVFDDVEHKRADFGVVPVENNTEGAVNVTLDRLIDSDVLICGELRLEITQNLLSRATGLDGIKRVLSHPQGLAQCRGWLAQHLPDVATEQALSTAAATETAAADVTVAAIASDLAAELYGLPILRPASEDKPHQPAPRATERIAPGRIPGIAFGRSTSGMVCQRVAPSASDASRISPGTVRSASPAATSTTGRLRSASASAAQMRAGWP